MDRSNWNKLIKEAAGDDKIIACTLTEKELRVWFKDGSGGTEGKPFTAWSRRYVYFPVIYDGIEWVNRVPRVISMEATKHIGRQ